MIDVAYYWDINRMQALVTATAMIVFWAELLWTMKLAGGTDWWRPAVIPTGVTLLIGPYWGMFFLLLFLIQHAIWAATSERGNPS